MNLRPLIWSGVLLGMGLGGFFDGWLFHQVLQVHNMVSARIPPDTMQRMKVGMFWDGVFHAGAWALALAGLIVLVSAGSRPDLAWSGRVFWGSWLLGWGLFNLLEGIIDHHLLGLHHVLEAAPANTRAMADFAFLASGVVLGLIGWGMIRAGSAGYVKPGPLHEVEEKAKRGKPYVS